ncbi:hypothetical protein [Bacillus sp. FJAT-45066]|uniref:hypothetical protein n=1 Tax=Bacillus sp. FJAT-45066 TaxID=2011010 RepID=UPI000BB967FE|nr:hypothetical protein [Bacillus sp. FJAT-45066]
MTDFLDKEKLKRDVDQYISPHSLYTGIDQKRVLERIQSSRGRKRYIKNPRIMLSVIVFFLAVMVGMSFVGNEESRLGAEHWKEQLYLGMEKEDVLRVLGENYVEVEPADGVERDVVLWRYDFVQEPEYVYEEPYDFVDIDGVVSGKMDYQIIINLGSDEVVRYTILYKDGEGKNFIYTNSVEHGEQEHIVNGGS